MVSVPQPVARSATNQGHCQVAMMSIQTKNVNCSEQTNLGTHILTLSTISPTPKTVFEPCKARPCYGQCISDELPSKMMCHLLLFWFIDLGDLCAFSTFRGHDLFAASCELC